MNIRIILTFFILLIYSAMAGQTLMPIYSFATERHTPDWYKEQASLWNNEIKKDKNNAYAWYNYYRATRNQLRLDTNDKRSHDEKATILNNIVNDMGQAVPESFEYNLSRWLIGGNDNQYLPHLKKAATMGAEREEIVSEMINWGETDRNITMRDKYAALWFNSKLASPGLLNYNYNVMAGLKPNAILLTVGDNDTYPIWQLQSQGIRKDITVLNLSLLNIDTYRDKVFKELNISKWDTALHSGKSINDNNTYIAEIIRHIATNTGHHPVYVALTTGEEYTNPVADNLYLTGLAYEYSDQPIDNMALLKKNFEQNYALDYIEHRFFKDISEYYTICVNENYIVPMLKLYDHYKEAGDIQKTEWIKHKILILAEKSEHKSTILNHLN